MDAGVCEERLLILMLLRAWAASQQQHVPSMLGNGNPPCTPLGPPVGKPPHLLTEGQVSNDIALSSCCHAEATAGQTREVWDAPAHAGAVHITRMHKREEPGGANHPSLVRTQHDRTAALIQASRRQRLPPPVVVARDGSASGRVGGAITPSLVPLRLLSCFLSPASPRAAPSSRTWR